MAFVAQIVGACGGLSWVSVFGFRDWSKNLLAILVSSFISMHSLWPLVSMQMGWSRPAGYNVKIAGWFSISLLVIVIDAIGSPEGAEKFAPRAVLKAKSMLSLTLHQ